MLMTSTFNRLQTGLSTPLQATVPRLAIALGDPAGIGAEVVLKAIADPSHRCELTLVGNLALLRNAYQQLRHVQPTVALANPDELTVLDVPLEPALERQIKTGIGNAASGEASFRFLDQAIAQTLAGQFHGVVTAPIAKSAWQAAGHGYPGQTELLAERAGVKRFGMLFVARSPHTGWALRTLLATTHIPLQAVPTALTPELMTLKLELLIECLKQDFGLDQPRIAIAGLNPHSGEAGQLGREEVDWMLPWLESMRDRWPQVALEGLIPPDTLWVKPGHAWFRAGHTAHDAYLALYHDQGLIPVKLMAFDRAVNTTIGLSFIRTSPDHGTAFDIAGRGIADSTSFKSAIEFAAELAHQRFLR
jgi:4-hydroxythreonine-4-phosphate dehydrogenase